MIDCIAPMELWHILTLIIAAIPSFLTELKPFNEFYS